MINFYLLLVKNNKMDQNVIIIIIMFVVVLIGYLIYVSYEKYKENPNRFLKIWFVEAIVEFFIGLFKK